MKHFLGGHCVCSLTCKFTEKRKYFSELTCGHLGKRGVNFSCVELYKVSESKLLHPVPRQTFPGGSVVKNPPANAGDERDVGSITRWGGYPGEGNGNPLQYSCPGKVMDRGAWRSTVHGVARVKYNLTTKPPAPPESSWALELSGL